MKVMSASEIARALLPPSEWPSGSTEDQIFGKIFEEEFSLWCHLYDSMRVGPKSGRLFAAKMAQRLKEEGVYTRDRVLKAYRIAAALISAGARGETPPTMLHRLDDEHGIFYKPDLWDPWSDEYYEFKTHPITRFDEVQSSIFALCVGKPIKLLGVEFDEKGIAHAQVKTIKPFEDVEKLKEIIANYGEEYEEEYGERWEEEL